jgi:hypothetical protein
MPKETLPQQSNNIPPHSRVRSTESLNNLFMRLPLVIISTISFVILLYGCSKGVFQSRNNKVYEAPAMGAESRFDEGLRREKHPQQLFNKKERADMGKMGWIGSDERAAPNTRISPGRADSLLTGKTDSTHIPADSTRTAIDSTAAPKDTVHHPTSY